MNFKFWQSKKATKTQNKDSDQPEYEIKSYSKDGGYIRSPVRTGKNNNSSSFEGWAKENYNYD